MSAKDNDLTNKHESDVYTDKVDSSGYVESNTAPHQQALQRQLKNRHVAMIRYLQLDVAPFVFSLKFFLCVHLVLEVRDIYETKCS